MNYKLESKLIEIIADLKNLSSKKTLKLALNPIIKYGINSWRFQLSD